MKMYVLEPDDYATGLCFTAKSDAAAEKRAVEFLKQLNPKCVPTRSVATDVGNHRAICSFRTRESGVTYLLQEVSEWRFSYD